MLDETIVTETPPLYNCYGRIGEQVRVPISGSHAKRVLHGAINIRSGDLALLITEDWTRDSHEAFLRSIRAHWRGWDLVIFEDRATQHKSARAWGPGGPEDRDPVTAASDLGIECHGPPLATHEARGPGRPGDAVDRCFGDGGVSVPDRPEPA
jgi:hypothetical protein